MSVANVCIFSKSLLQILNSFNSIGFRTFAQDIEHLNMTHNFQESINGPEICKEGYVVEKILAKRIEHDNVEYLVKWKGHSDLYNTWECKESLNCPVLVQDFELEQENSATRIETSEEQPYVAEKVLDLRIVDDHVEYLVKWKAQSHAHNTWEPEEHLTCPDLVNEFWERRRQKAEEAEKAMLLPECDNDKQKDASAEDTFTFFQIRRKFEESSKATAGVCKTPENDSLSAIKSISEFQSLYPLYKHAYSKRQFAALEGCFELADRNHDGFLEPKEVRQLLIDNNIPTNLCDAEAIVGKGDINEDGKLCATEFLALCTPIAEKLKQKQYEQGESRSLEPEEFIKQVLQTVRNLVSSVNGNIKGTRRFFETIGSGNVEEIQCPTKKPVVSRYLQALETTKEAELTGE